MTNANSDEANINGLPFFVGNNEFINQMKNVTSVNAYKKYRCIK
jgi:hypothetical protein